MLRENEVLVFQTKPCYETLWKQKELLKRNYLRGLFSSISSGNTVVIKPNFVKEHHMYKPGEWDYVITHPVLIRIVLEEVVRCLDGKGTVYVIDAPQTDSDYEKIMEETRLPEILEEMQKETSVNLRCFDLREERWFYKDGIIVKRKKLPGDPNGYVSINLQNTSEFYGKKSKEYYGADYDMEETRKYHNDIDNIYIMSKTVLSADVFINMPKLKTHKLGGVTISLKNLVGTCVIKNSIPHHTLGSPETGGDKFKQESAKNRSESALKGIALKLLKAKNPVINYPFIFAKKIAGLFYGSPQSETIRNGMWYGNDTIWRSIVDLNKILLYADDKGKMHDTIQRKYICIVDGILAGEKNGPMEPDKKDAGVILAGLNPLAVDTVGATIMGMDYKKIPSIVHGFHSVGYDLANFGPNDIKIQSNEKAWNKNIAKFVKSDTLCFEPHFGWKGYIELEDGEMT